MSKQEQILISIKGADELSPVLSSLSGKLGGFGKQLGDAGTQANNSTGLFSKLSGAFGNMATVAGGMIAADIFGKISSGLASFVTDGLAAVGAAQQLEISLEALLTSNNMYQRSMEEVTTATTTQTMTQSEYAQKVDELTAKLNTQRATYQEQQEKIRQLTERYGENGLVVLKEKAAHEQLAVAIRATEQDISGLSTSTTTYSTDLVATYGQVMNFEEAQAKAAAQTKDLMGYIDELAIKSIFESAQVAQVAKLAAQVGMGTDQVKKFSSGFLDLASAVGIGSNELEFAGSQLLQVAKIGKLTTIDLRQLKRLGIDLEKIIGVEMGMSVDEFNKKAEKSPEIFDQLFSSITTYSEKTFKGMAAKSATTITGMAGVFKDAGTVGAKNFWRPLAEAVGPILTPLLDTFTNFAVNDMKNVGQLVADNFLKIVSLIQSGGLMPAISNLLSTGWATYVQPTIDSWVEFASAWVKNLIATLPARLNLLMNTLNTFLVQQGPVIMEKTQAWAEAALAWVGTAISKIGTVLGALLVSIAAWATSSEAQSQLGRMGFTLGQFIVDGIGLLTQDTAKLADIMTKLAGGLAAAALAITGILIVVGGQIVAGMLAGILSSLGIDLKPAVFNELGTIWGGIGQNMVTITNKIGMMMLEGLRDGILAGIKILTQPLEALGLNVMETVNSIFGIASPSTVFFNVGLMLIQGLIDGLASMGGAITEAIGSIFSNLFGGADQVDFSALLKSLLTDIPAAVSGLGKNFQAMFTNVQANLALVITSGLMVLISTLMEIYSTHIPTLQDAFNTMGNAIINMTNRLISSLQNLIAILNQAVNKANEMADAFDNISASAVEDVADALRTQLIPAIDDATEAYWKMAEAAIAADTAGQGAADGAPTGDGGGLAAGGPVMPGLSYWVGEEGPELVTPTRRGYVNPYPGEAKAGDTFILNIYPQTIDEGGVIEGFNMLKALSSNAA